MKLGYIPIALLLSIPLDSETLDQKPHKAVEEILDAPATPALSVSPAGTHAILSEPLRYPPIADLAAPLHWYEASGIGKKDFKIKRFVD